MSCNTDSDSIHPDSTFIRIDRCLKSFHWTTPIKKLYISQLAIWAIGSYSFDKSSYGYTKASLCEEKKKIAVMPENNLLDETPRSVVSRFRCAHVWVTMVAVFKFKFNASATRWLVIGWYSAGGGQENRWNDVFSRYIVSTLIMVCVIKRR